MSKSKKLISFVKDKTNTWNMIGFNEVDNFKLIDNFVNKKIF